MQIIVSPNQSHRKPNQDSLSWSRSGRPFAAWKQTETAGIRFSKNHTTETRKPGKSPQDDALVHTDKPTGMIQQDVSNWLIQTFVKQDPDWMGHHLMVKKMARAGLTGVGLAESLQQPSRVPMPKLAATVDAMFYTFPNMAAWVTVNNHLAAFPLMLAGSDSQKQHFLAPMMKGEKIGSIALPENNPGRHPQRLTTTALPDGKYWIINTDEDLYIPNGNMADTVLLVAKTPTESGGWEDVAFIVDRFWERPEVVVKTPKGDTNPVNGNRAIVGLKNLRVHRRYMLGGPSLKGHALDLGLMTLNQARNLSTAMLSGKLRSTFDRTLFFATSHIQRETPVLNDENILQRIANMANDVFTVQALSQNASQTQEGLLKDLAKEGKINLPSAHTLPEPLRKATIQSAVAKTVAEEALNRQGIESLQVLDGVGLIDHADRQILQQMSSWAFPKVDGTTDMNRLLIAYGLRKYAEENPYQPKRWFGRMKQRWQTFRFKELWSPSTSLEVAQRLLSHQEQLFEKTFQLVLSQPIAKSSPIMPSIKTADGDPPGLEQVHPQIRDARIFLALANMMVELEKTRAVVNTAKTFDNDAIASLQSKMISIDSTRNFLQEMEKIYQANGQSPKLGRLYNKLNQYSLIDGNGFENRRQIVTTQLKRSRELFETEKGQDLLLSLMVNGYDNPEHLMTLSRRLSMVGHVPENFIPANHFDKMIKMAHKLNKLFLPGVLKIKQVDMPDSDLERLAELHQNRQVFFAPNHPTGPCEIVTAYEVVGRASKKAGFIRPLFMAADILFGGPFKTIFPWLGAFSIARSQENNKSITFIEKAAQAGENLIIVYPEGESSFLNHAVLPFKYGTANIAVKAALDPSSKKPITIVPVAMVFHYTEPIQKAIHERMAQLEDYLKSVPPTGTLEPEVIFSPSAQSRRLKNVVQEFIRKTIEDLNRVTPDQSPAVVPNLPLIEQIEWMKQEILERLEMKYLHKTVEGYQISRMRRLNERMSTKASLALTRKQKEAIRFDQYLLRMIKHLAGFQPFAYENRHSLTQDQVSEIIIKLEQATGLSSNVRKGLMGLEYFGPRQAVIRMDTPIHVNEWLKENEGRYAHWREAATQITQIMQTRTQSKLDEIYGQLNANQPYWYPNPLI